MDPSRFSDRAPGELYDDEGYYAFRPDDLPPDFEISGELANTLAEASRAIGNLSGIGHTVDNPAMILRPFIRKEAVNSSQIEGTKATLSDLYAHEAGQDTIIDTRGRDDVTEVFNYVRAMEQGITALSDSQITLDLVKELHETLLTGVRGEEKNPGKFRTTQNALGSHDPMEARYVPPPPHFVSPAMANLEAFIQSGRELNHLIAIGIAHYQFETIHPFLDGNGRIGRLVITLMLYDRGLLPHPFLYFSTYFNQHREEYVERLFSVSTEGDWVGWLQFFLRGVTEQAEEAFQRAKCLLQLKEIYRERYQGRRSETLLGLVYELFNNPFITAKMVESKFDVTNPTANSTLSELEKDGVLTEVTGKQRYRVYKASDILAVIDQPLDDLDGAIRTDTETELTETTGDFEQTGIGEFE